MRIPLVGQAYPARSLAVSAQECLNVFPQIIQDPNEQEKNKGVLYGCPGKHLGATTAAIPRGMWSGAGRLFQVEGTNIVERNSAYGVVSTTALPGAVNDGLPAQIFSNGNQLLVIAGGLAFCDTGTGVIAITTDNYAGNVFVSGPFVNWVGGDKFLTDGSWNGRAIVIGGVPYTIFKVTADDSLILTTGPGGGLLAYTALGEALTAVTGGVMNETFFVQRPPTVGHPEFGAQINFSAVLDGTTWSGLDFFRKEGAPDNIVGIVTDNNQLYAMGAETFEVYQADLNATQDTPAFISIPGAMGHYGNSSPWGMFAVDGRVFFMGTDDKGGPIAYVLDGFTPRRISTHAEEAAWHSAGLGRNVVGYAYNEEGHTFCGWNFGAQSWFYDPETGAWHSRAKWNGAAFVPYQTNLHTYIPEWGANGVHVTACSTGPAEVCESNINFYDDKGTDIKWRRALSYLYNDGKRMFFGRMDLDMETGAVPSGAAPIITLDFSDDRGETFANGRDSNEGVHGDFAHRVFWNRNGSSFGRVWRLAGIGQSKVALVDLQCDITLGGV